MFFVFDVPLSQSANIRLDTEGYAVLSLDAFHLVTLNPAWLTGPESRRKGMDSMEVIDLRRRLAAFVSPLLVLAIVGMAHAATFTVTNTNDSAKALAGDGTLRGEILAANLAGGTNTINFQAGLVGTIGLASALPKIGNGNTLTISGPIGSPGITISGGGRVPIIVSFGTLNISNLTIANGKSNSLTASGGILNFFGTLSIANSTFSGNISAHGGGAIQNLGPLTVTNSTFSRNTAPEDGGGAIGILSGTATITNSTFANNGTATNDPSTDTISGGAIYNNGGTILVTNCTFSGNSAESGGGVYGDSVTVTNSTFLGNSAFPGNGGAIRGGVRSTGRPTLKGTILAGSLNDSGNCAGIVDRGYNISDDDSCDFTEPPTGTSTNGSTSLNLDPAGLHNNGGPTETIALKPGSNAIGFDTDCTHQATPPNPVLTDQRGLSRPDSPTLCDSGAYEHDGVGAFAGTPGNADCDGVTVEELSKQYGSLDAAAALLGYQKVEALHDAIRAFCGR
jgi:predicted outer membrane repeat protein